MKRLALAMLLVGCGGDPFSAALVDAPAADAAPALLSPTLDAGAAGDVDPPITDDAGSVEASRIDTYHPPPAADAGDDARAVHLVDAGAVDVAELPDALAADAGDAAAGETSTPLPEAAPPPPPLCCFTPCGGGQVAAITCGNGPDWTCDSAGGASCASLRCTEESSCHWQGTSCVGTVRPCS